MTAPNNMSTPNNWDATLIAAALIRTIRKISVNRLVSVIGIFLLTAGWPWAETQAGEIRVGPNVQVSLERRELPHAEVILSADLSDPQRLLAGSMLRYESGEDQCIGYLSTDGGKTWTTVLEPGARAEIRGARRAADPAIAFAADSTAYYAMLAAEARLAHHRAVVYRSVDGGKTWGDAVHVHRATRMDRPFIAVDQTGGKHHGRVYCNAVPVTDSLSGTGPTSADGVPQTGIALFYSSDRGETFSEPVLQRIRMANLPHGARGANCCVASDGTIVILYDTVENWRERKGSPHLLAIERSTDGGQSLEEASQSIGARPPLDNALPLNKFIAKTAPDVGAGVVRGIPCLAVDISAGANRDRLYAVWEAFDGTQSRVMISASADKGLNWSVPAQVSDGTDAGAAGNYRGASMPAVAVNTNGVVGVSWYDTRDATGPDQGWDMRFTVSHDAGTTWEPSVRVSETSSMFTEAVRNRLVRVWRGDTTGLAASADGAFHPLWIDTRTGVPQVWTATVTVYREP